MAVSATEIPDLTANRPPRPRHFVPLSLRLFAVVLAAVGLGSALWIGVPAGRQYAAIWDAEQIGGRVYFSRRAGPAWLRVVAGHEFMRAFDEVDSVILPPCEDTVWEKRGGSYSGPTRWTDGPIDVSDTTLRCVRGIPRLKSLDLSYTNVGDRGISQIALLRHLEFLDLQFTEYLMRAFRFSRSFPS